MNEGPNQYRTLVEMTNKLLLNTNILDVFQFLVIVDCHEFWNLKFLLLSIVHHFEQEITVLPKSFNSLLLVESQKIVPELNESSHIGIIVVIFVISVVCLVKSPVKLGQIPSTFGFTLFVFDFLRNRMKRICHIYCIANGNDNYSPKHHVSILCFKL